MNSWSTRNSSTSEQVVVRLKQREPQNQFCRHYVLNSGCHYVEYRYTIHFLSSITSYEEQGAIYSASEFHLPFMDPQTETARAASQIQPSASTLLPHEDTKVLAIARNEFCSVAELPGVDQSIDTSETFSKRRCGSQRRLLGSA